MLKTICHECLAVKMKPSWNSLEMDGKEKLKPVRFASLNKHGSIIYKFVKKVGM